MQKNKKNNIYLFLYVLLIVLLFGSVLINQLTDYILEKKKTPDYSDITAVVKNATNNYIEKNPELKNKLFYTNRFIDINIKTLIDGGFIKSTLYNPKKGENIALLEKVRITSTNDNLINIIYPVKEREDGYYFEASDLVLNYGETSTFCDDEHMLYKGLFGTNYEGITKYKMGLVYFSRDNALSGKYYNKDYFGSPVNLKVTSCNVDTKKAGNYEVNYEYTDFDNNKQTFKRKVIIKKAPNDLKSFKVVINDNKEIDYKNSKVKAVFEEKYENGNISKKDLFLTNIDGAFKVLDINGAETNYYIEYFTTEKIGKNMESIIKTKKVNSDGRLAKDETVKYSVELPTPSKPVVTQTNNVLTFTSDNPVSEISYFYGCNKKKQDKEGNNIKISSKCKKYYVKACNITKCSEVVEYDLK